MKAIDIVKGEPKTAWEAFNRQSNNLTSIFISGSTFSKKIAVKQVESVMVLNEDNEFVCPHTDAYIEPACCSSRGSSGYIDCGCGGNDAVICPADDCTGIQEWELDDLMEMIS